MSLIKLDNLSWCQVKHTRNTIICWIAIWLRNIKTKTLEVRLTWQRYGGQTDSREQDKTSSSVECVQQGPELLLFCWFWLLHILPEETNQPESAKQNKPRQFMVCTRGGVGGKAETQTEFRGCHVKWTFSSQLETETLTEGVSVLY